MTLISKGLSVKPDRRPTAEEINSKNFDVLLPNNFIE